MARRPWRACGAGDGPARTVAVGHRRCPLIWPALLAAALLAWTQVLTWMPYGLPGLRVIVAVLWLTTIDAVVIVGDRFRSLGAPDGRLPGAAASARVSRRPLRRARARRGDVPDWRGAFARARPDRRRPRRAGASTFVSAARAQAWFEWRQHGRSLPALVAILLPFELALLLFLGNDAPGARLLHDLLVACCSRRRSWPRFVAATVSKANPDASDSYGVHAVHGDAAADSAALVAAKLKMTIWSTLAAWLLVARRHPAWRSRCRARWPVVVERRASRDRGRRHAPRDRGRAAGVRGLLDGVDVEAARAEPVHRPDRPRMAHQGERASRPCRSLVIIGPIARLDHRDRGRADRRCGTRCPGSSPSWSASRCRAAAWIAIRLYRSRLLSDRALVTGAACWLVAVLALYGVLVWLLDTPLDRRTTSSRSSRSWPSRWRGCPRRRWRSAWNRHR